MYQWLAYYELPILVVATKIDKVKPSQFTKVQKLVKDKLEFQGKQPLVLFSAMSKRGKEDVWRWIEEQTGVS